MTSPLVLFDLDGTLVQTDSIYVDVWKKLLLEVNLTVDSIFFDNLIRGKSDYVFLKYLMPTLSDEDISELSGRKDALFVEMLDQYEGNILNEGVYDFLGAMMNAKCCMAVVTSCNRRAAEFLLKKTGIEDMFSLLIAADDCDNHKPHPEPYLKAINALKDSRTSKVLIFEDSISGYLSAKHANPDKIYVYTGAKASDEVLQVKDFKFDEYSTLNVEEIIHNETTQSQASHHNVANYAPLIKNLLSDLPVQHVGYNDENIKTGYICDINSFTISYINGEKSSVILKMSNLGTDLSIVATKLDMYEVETYFYESLSSVVSSYVRIPKHYGTLRDNERVGILLEDLRKLPGSFNHDLNHDVDILLGVVKHAHSMHSTFFFEKDDSVLSSMRRLRTVDSIMYYQDLVRDRFEIFMSKNRLFLSEKDKEILTLIKDKFSVILELLSTYPISFCHGDLKSPNIFYANNCTPYFLDWQYAHLNKGVSDIAFLLVESIHFEKNLVSLVERYYFKLENQRRNHYTYEQHMNEFRLALCSFPFFVCVWFNSENTEKLLDKAFPIKFMKNLLAFYDEYLSAEFLKSL